MYLLSIHIKEIVKMELQFESENGMIRIPKPGVQLTGFDSNNNRFRLELIYIKVEKLGCGFN